MEKMTLKQLQGFFIETYGDHKEYGITKAVFNSKKQLIARIELIKGWDAKAAVLSKRA